LSTTVTGANQITLVIDQGILGPTGPVGAAGAQGNVGPTGAAGTGLQVQGVVATPAQLPMVGNQPGDTYIVLTP